MFVGEAVAVVVDAVAVVVDVGRAGLAVVDGGAIHTHHDRRRGARPDPARDRRREEVLVVGPVAVVVDPVAVVVVRRLARRAGGHRLAVDAGRLARGRARADPARHVARLAVLVGGPVTVIVDAVAVVVVRRLAGGAVVDHLPRDAQRRPRRRARSDPAGHRARQEVLVRLTVTVVVDPVAVVVRGRLAGRAAAAALAAQAADHPDSLAGPCAAGRLRARDVLVGLAVAVLVDPVAYRVLVGPGLVRATGVDVLPLHTAHDAHRRAGSLAAARGRRGEVLVGGAVAVIVDAVAVVVLAAAPTGRAVEVAVVAAAALDDRRAVQAGALEALVRVARIGVVAVGLHDAAAG